MTEIKKCNENKARHCLDVLEETLERTKEIRKADVAKRKEEFINGKPIKMRKIHYSEENISGWEEENAYHTYGDDVIDKLNFRKLDFEELVKVTGKGEYHPPREGGGYVEWSWPCEFGELYYADCVKAAK